MQYKFFDIDSLAEREMGVAYAWINAGTALSQVRDLSLYHIKAAHTTFTEVYTKFVSSILVRFMLLELSRSGATLFCGN